MATCPECRVRYGDDVHVCPEDESQLVSDEIFAAVKSDLDPGAMVGEYRIERKIGSGTFGDVYAAEHPVIGKQVAIKVLARRFASDPEMVSRFITEARAVNKIRQRNIIDVFSFGVVRDRHYFVMELLEGLTLRDLLEREGRLPVGIALLIARGIADALDAAHAVGITHRDLKPENVFLVMHDGGGYFPKLLDFGIAKLIGDEHLHRTGTGMTLGTPAYMSPEQALAKKTDFRSDIYSLGALVHELMTGAPPFVSDSVLDLMVKQTKHAPKPMSETCPELPAGLDAPVLAMLEKRPQDRPESAGAAIAALEKVERTSGRTSGSGETTRTVIAVRSAPPSPLIDDATLLDKAPAQVGARTLSSVSSSIRPAVPSRTKAVAFVSTLGVAGGVLVALALHRSPTVPARTEPPVAAIVVTPAAALPQLAPAPTAATAPPSPETVTLRLTTQPDGVEVWLKDVKLGASSQPLELPRGSAPLKLRLKKTGFREQALEVTPDHAQEMAAKLAPVPLPSGAGSPADNLDAILGHRD